jgi:hypothetical protein
MIKNLITFMEDYKIMVLGIPKSPRRNEAKLDSYRSKEMVLENTLLKYY